MKKIMILIALFSFMLPTMATEDIIQEIKNEKGFTTINLDSQITPEGKIKKQKITNERSAFNININRNTYKFYCESEKEK